MDFSVLIIGAGVVGLACAAECAKRGFSTLLIERHHSFGQETSSRNSEVVHSGIYYAPNTIKARLCVPANANLYSYCEQNNVWFNKCGKLIVAVTEEEIPELEKLFQRSKLNGVPNVELLTSAQAKSKEPNITCVAALYLPSTGIIDSHELMRAYMHEAKSHGAEIIFDVSFQKLIDNNNGFNVSLLDARGEAMELKVQYIINSAGLGSSSVAQSFGIDIDSAGYRMYPNRGHYFRVASSKSTLVSHLVYPVPPPKHVGLGTHITIDRGGQIKLGPDLEYCIDMPESQWYQFDESRKEKFFQSVHRYFPALELEDLSPDQIGVRPKIQKPGDDAKDFVIQEETQRGLPGLVNLIGIESPGLTCAREIAVEAIEKLAL